MVRKVHDSRRNSLVRRRVGVHGKHRLRNTQRVEQIQLLVKPPVPGELGMLHVIIEEHQTGDRKMRLRHPRIARVLQTDQSVVVPGLDPAVLQIQVRHRVPLRDRKQVLERDEQRLQEARTQRTALVRRRVKREAAGVLGQPRIGMTRKEHTAQVHDAGDKRRLKLVQTMLTKSIYVLHLNTRRTAVRIQVDRRRRELRFHLVNPPGPGQRPPAEPPDKRSRCRED